MDSGGFARPGVRRGLGIVGALALVVALLAAGLAGVGPMARGLPTATAPNAPRATPGGGASAALNCTGLHPTDLVPWRSGERATDVACSLAHRPASLGAGAPGTAATAPPGFGIYNLAMTYDAADGYVLLLGATGVGPLNGTETWTFAGGRWTQQDPANSPESCMGSALAYDDHDGYVVYFGGANFGTANCSSAGTTWTWLAGVWTQLTPATSPPARQAAAFTNDSADGYLLLFGGLSPACTGGICGDTWTFAGGSWTERFPTVAPSSRSGAGMTFDAYDGYVLLFGGSGFNGSRTASYGCTGPNQDGSYCMDRDTWAYRGGNWTQLAPVGAVPPEPYDDGLTYDAADRAALYTVTDDNYSADPEIWWTFQGGNWTNPGNNDALFDVNRSSLPSNRFGEGLAYDWADGYAVMFGGAGVNWSWLNDTWTYALGNWTEIPSPGSSSPTYPVLFAEGGLPAGTYWSITTYGANRTAGPGVGSTGTQLVLYLANGTWIYVLGPVPGYLADPSNGTVVVAGATTYVNVTFAPSPTYTVTFVATGLPAGIAWSVSIGGSVASTSGPSISVSLASGVWGFVVLPPSGWIAQPSNGTLALGAANLTVGVAFFALSPPRRRPPSSR